MVRYLSIKIRKATIDDIQGITIIYNEAIKNTVSTFDTEEETISKQKKWFKEHGPKNPIIVAEQDMDIVGWTALSKYSTKCAYSDFAEISLYIKKEKQGQNIGKKLIKKIVEEGKKAGLHALIAQITERNKISIHLHESVGFHHVGVLKEAGFKFGKRLDVYLMEKIYK